MVEVVRRHEDLRCLPKSLQDGEAFGPGDRLLVTWQQAIAAGPKLKGGLVDACGGSAASPKALVDFGISSGPIRPDDYFARDAYFTVGAGDLLKGEI